MRPLDRKKPMVFLVDDDANVLRSLRVVLMRDYLVETCQSSVQAVGAIKEKNPDVIVLDLKMPERDGFWLFSEIRKSDMQVPVILNSAFQWAMLPEDVLASYKPFAYLQKSGSLAEFQATMSRAVKQRGW